jgi:hypothetical protein
VLYWVRHRVRYCLTLFQNSDPMNISLTIVWEFHFLNIEAFVSCPSFVPEKMGINKIGIN